MPLFLKRLYMTSGNVWSAMGLIPWQGLSMPVVVNILSAVLFGCVIGIERSARGRQAGMRTYALVSLSSACLVSAISLESSAMSIGDPVSRVIQGLLTGLGFLGAGVIMQSGLNIKGLTTAASIWVTAGIGIMCGLGLWGLGLFATICSLSILSGFRFIEAKLPKDLYANINIKVPAESLMGASEVKALLNEEGLRTLEIAFKRDVQKHVEFQLTAVYSKHEAPNLLAKKLIAMNDAIEAFEISSSPE